MGSHLPKETLATPECRGSAQLLTEDRETHFLDESWELLCLCENRLGFNQFLEILRLFFFNLLLTRG